MSASSSTSTQHNKKVPSSHVLRKLFNRSIDGRHIIMQIHQHFGYCIHMVWKDSIHHKEMCFERNLSWCHDLKYMRPHITTHPIRGTCNCMIDACESPPPGFVGISCDRRWNTLSPLHLKYKDDDRPPWVLRMFQDLNVVNRCECLVTSSEFPAREFYPNEYNDDGYIERYPAVYSNLIKKL